MYDIISFPHLGDYSVPIKFFLKKITKMKVVEAPPITKKTIKLGELYSPEDVCVPFKYNLGNFIEALENNATILVQAGGGCRYRYYAEVQEKILRDMGYNFKFIKLMNNSKYDIFKMFHKFRDLNPNLQIEAFIYYGITSLLMVRYMDKIDEFIRKNIGFEVIHNSFIDLKKEMLKAFSSTCGIRDLRRTYKLYFKRFKKLKVKKKKPIKIGVIGELYTSMEKESTYDLEMKLARNNIEIKRFTNLSYLLFKKGLVTKWMLFKTRKYCKYTLGADGLDNVYRCLWLKKHKFDGVIHTKPFGCTPEIGAIPIIKNVCNDKNLPIIFFSFDSQSVDTGIDTRLEAFFDMLKYRRMK